jgi:hypothetical protein
MSFAEKHDYKIFNIRYASEQYLETVRMSQFPTNEEILQVIMPHLSYYTDMSDYRIERVDDKWFKPIVNIYDLQNNGTLFLRINP